MSVLWIALVVIGIIVFIKVKPYFIKYDTICAYTGGLGTGKSFMSVEAAVRELKKNRLRTWFYNLKERIRHPKNPCLLLKPLLYSSIPIRISRKEMSVVLTADMLTLQEGFVKGSVVFIDEIDVWANQFSFANHNIIEMSNKKDIKAKREGAPEADYDSGLFDEEIRLFRHYYSSPACECKLVCNSQATSNIVTVIRRRMNTVFVLSTFRKYKLPLIGLFLIPYTVKVRNITITDEITNTAENNAEDNCSTFVGIMPAFKRYDTHCYKHRADTLPVKIPCRWSRLTTERLLKAPIDLRKSKTKNAD